MFWSCLCTCVQVSGQTLLPGMAMCEAATAAVSIVMTSQPRSTAAALESISIAAPMAIGTRGDSVLEVSLLPAAGGLTVYSLAGTAARRQLHMRASAALTISDRPTASAAPPASRAEQDDTQEAVAKQGVASSQGLRPRCVAALLDSAEQLLQRYNGGAVAALDDTQASPGSGYALHPAIADACLHTGAVFVPVPTSTESDAAPRASATVPVAVAALASPSGVESAYGGVYGSMGAARLLQDGTSFCDFRLRSAAEEPRTIMALAQLQAKPVAASKSENQPITAAQAIESMLYAVEWRVTDVGAAEGSLSMRLPSAPRAAAWAAVPQNGLLRRFKLPRTAANRVVLAGDGVRDGVGTGAQSAVMAAGSLAVVQELLRMPFAAGQRLQLNTAGPLSDGGAPISGQPAGAMASASAAAILKVEILHCCACFGQRRQLRQRDVCSSHGQRCQAHAQTGVDTLKARCQDQPRGNLGMMLYSLFAWSLLATTECICVVATDGGG